ncbi:MAG: hypothetical protein J3K34DRAFT_378736 [Monoraphidium minutum]|nr:MAG: hypothetical protein J3K34DRAFT_378736 [Monoraphidium minutum]
MSGSAYFLGFAFLTSTTLLFILWHIWAHCCAAHARQQGQPRSEDRAVAWRARADAAVLASVAGLTAAARGAPLFLIRALPTHVFSGGGGKGSPRGSKEEDTIDGEPCDVEAGGHDQAPGPRGCAFEMGKRQPEDARQHHCTCCRHRGGGGDGGGGGEGGQQRREGCCAGGATSACGQERQPIPQQRLRRPGERARAPRPGTPQGSSQQQPCSGGADAGGGGGSGSEAGEGPPECSICLECYVGGDVVKHLPCGHAYHAACVDAWLRRSASCPLCKLNLYMCFP